MLVRFPSQEDERSVVRALISGLAIAAVLLVSCGGCSSAGKQKQKEGPTGPAFASIANTGKSDDPVIEDIVSRTVVVSAAGAGCSGTIVATGIVLTAGHCYREGTDIYVNNKLAKVLLREHTPGLGDSLDMMLLSVSTAEVKPVVRATPKLGEPVILVTNQLYYGNVVMKGYVMHVSPDWVMSDIVAIPGASGSVLFNMQGEMVGLHVRFVGALDPNRKINEFIGTLAVNADKIEAYLLSKMGAES